jgi:serine/threonine-protein kinase
MGDYEDIFEGFGLGEETLQLPHGATIVPEGRHAQATAARGEDLPEITLSRRAADEGEYRILETIGQGGMGVISLAEQKALRRMVAIKEPREDDLWTRGRVLEEALVMGRMEHPNVVPAYGLGRRPGGGPILVMKRVEGVNWRDVIAGRERAPDGAPVDLVWHLKVLLQVCNALRFAHSRRVVHRDIKPENVMIGEFGEVYLLDWGIALSLEEQVVEGFPTRKSSTGLAGTPAFMAPEMAVDDPSRVDERTDVYLLGATLHMVLTGEPPHAGDTLFEVCQAAFASRPHEYPDDVPSGLAEIANRAMARERGDRYPSAAAFAAALEGYLEHRASYTLSAAAEAMLRRAREEGASAAGAAALLEAEFGFRQALTIWPGNEGASAGLKDAVEEKVRAHLARGEVGAGRAALAQLDAPRPDLAADLDALEARLAERAERVEELERFERDLDLNRGWRSRRRAVIAFGVAFTALCWTQAWAAYHGEVSTDTRELLSVFWRLPLIAGVGTLIFRKALFRNVANRRLVAFFWSSLLFVFVLRFGAMYVEVSPTFAQLAEICVFGMTGFAMGVNTSRALTVASLGYGVAGMIGAWSGTLWASLLALGAQHALFFGLTAWLWRPKE